MQNSLLKFNAIAGGGHNIDQGVIASSHNEARRFGVDLHFLKNWLRDYVLNF